MYRRPNRLIIAQYERPKYISLMAAAELLGEGKRAVSAQLVDLAVRRVISISRPTGKGKRSGFTITVTGDASLEDLDEQSFIIALFDNHLPPIGAQISIAPGRNRRLGQALQYPHRFAAGRLVRAGLANERSLLATYFAPSRQVSVVPAERAYPIVDHLWGVRDYIAWAEKDRLAFLQSPEGADRRQLGELDVLRLHEKLLPFAILFGLEKEWMRELDLRVQALPAESLVDLELGVDALHLGVLALDVLVDFGDLVEIVSAADALEGVGAFFGGVAEFIGDIAN